MSPKSGWCMSRGASHHARCRPADCSCLCHESSTVERESGCGVPGDVGVVRYDIDAKREPDRVNESDSLATVSTTPKGA